MADDTPPQAPCGNVLKEWLDKIANTELKVQVGSLFPKNSREWMLVTFYGGSFIFGSHQDAMLTDMRQAVADALRKTADAIEQVQVQPQPTPPAVKTPASFDTLKPS